MKTFVFAATALAEEVVPADMNSEEQQKEKEEKMEEEEEEEENVAAVATSDIQTPDILTVDKLSPDGLLSEVEALTCRMTAEELGRCSPQQLVQMHSHLGGLMNRVVLELQTRLCQTVSEKNDASTRPL